MYQLVRGELRTGICPHFMRHVQKSGKSPFPLFAHLNVLETLSKSATIWPAINSIYELFQGHIHKKENAAQTKLMHRWKRGSAGLNWC